MKPTARFQFAVAATLSFAAIPAFTQGLDGLNLSWDDCGSFGVDHRDFACNSNSGINTLVGSGVVGEALDQVAGLVSVIDLQIAQPTLSPWWSFGSGDCRSSQLSASFDFTANTRCLDPWSGGATGLMDFAAGFGGPNHARIRAICAIPGSTSFTASDEYYFFKLAFTNARTVGNGSCAGCTDGACLTLQVVQLTRPAGLGDVVISQPLDRGMVRWNASAFTGCPGAVPTRNHTWGSVKSLYR